MPTSVDQTTETITKDYHTQTIQTDMISTNDYSCQITPEYIHQQTETIPILTQDIALQSSLDNVIQDDQQIQTDFTLHIDVSTQYDLDQSDAVILPIIFSEELPISNEIEIIIDNDKECQTIDNHIIQSDEYTQTPHIHLNDCASQSSIITYENQDVQTDFYSDLYSSSLYIVPTSINQSNCSSTIVIMPKDISPIVIDQEIQCNLCTTEPIIPIEIECKKKTNDRRSMIQQQMDEKEKQMNRIIGTVE